MASTRKRNVAVKDLIFTGFNSRVAALDKRSGKIVWDWKCPQGTGFVALLLDGEWLFASVDGYMYGLNAVNGQLVWYNEMKGFGYGVPCLVSSAGSSAAFSMLEMAHVEEKRRSDSTN